MERGHEDSICALDIHEMLANGVPDQEILLAWLTDLHFEGLYNCISIIIAIDCAIESEKRCNWEKPYGLPQKG